MDLWNLFWNNEYLFVGCNKNIIKLIDLNKGTIIKKIKCSQEQLTPINKFNHPIRI